MKTLINRVVILALLLFFSLVLPAQPLKTKLESALNSIPHPKSVSEFSEITHLSSVNQDSTLICWSFATNSFIESEMMRLRKEPVRLSVIFPVYYGFIEKAKRFIQTRGESVFSPGDLFNGVLEIAKKYGAVPAESYEGIKTPKTFFNHNKLYDQLETLMKEVKANGAWNEDSVLNKVKKILNLHLGLSPEKFIYREIEFTPKTFLSKVVDLPWNDYVFVTSFQYADFEKFIELKVPDNWKRDTNYFNVPLEKFYSIFLNAVKNGYTVAIDMDNSEPSYRLTKRYALIPNYEVHKDSITQAKREELFVSGATTDDHLMHIVAYKKFGDEEWFLAKDSWRTAWESGNNGYFFLHKNYKKLKVLAFLVHSDRIEFKAQEN